MIRCAGSPARRCCAACRAVVRRCRRTPRRKPTDLYTVSPKSTFDADLPAVYWQLAVEVPVAAANLNTGRIAIAPDADLVGLLLEGGLDRSGAADGADAHRRFLREHPQDRRRHARFDRRCAPTTCCSPTCATSRRCTSTASRRSCTCGIVAKLVRMPDRQIIGVASFERCVRARADKVPKVVEAFDQALGSVIKRLVAWTLRTPPTRPPSDRAPYDIEKLPQSGERCHRQRELPDAATTRPRCRSPTSRNAKRAQARFSTIAQASSAMRAGAVAVLGGRLRRGIAVEAALVDALHDGGEAEQREGDVELPVRAFPCGRCGARRLRDIPARSECRTP